MLDGQTKLQLVDAGHGFMRRSYVAGCDAFIERAVTLVAALMERYDIHDMAPDVVRSETQAAFDDLLALHEAIIQGRYLRGNSVPFSSSFGLAFSARFSEIRQMRLSHDFPVLSASCLSDIAPRVVRARAAAHVLMGGLTDSSSVSETKACCMDFQTVLWRAGSLRKWLFGRSAFTKDVMALTDTFRSACSLSVARFLAKAIDCEHLPLMSVGHAVADIFSTRLLAVLSGSPDADAWRSAAAATIHGIPVGVMRGDKVEAFIIVVHD